ncbi:MAG: anhydro-N-acetylmuramic acid kinase [Pseudomonadota bacterium]
MTDASAGDIFVGAISGTSMDGLDLAAISVPRRGKVSVLAAQTLAMNPELTDMLRELASSETVSWQMLGRADAELGEFIGHRIAEFLGANDLPSSAVKAVGSHGQTVRHEPHGPYPFSIQIGDPSRIANACGLPVVADFRRADIAAGGQGAPLVPPFHRHLFQAAEPRAVCNIGGISNLTVLRRGEPLVGFDTGPGNTLLDAWTRRHTEAAFDADGQWAREGQVDDELLQALLREPFFAAPPPKSTGPEQFNLDWLDAQLRDQRPVDIQATLVELTAVSIARAVERQAADCKLLILCGGGRQNPLLCERLSALLAPAETRVVKCDSLGVDGDSLEAAAFGWLAYRTLGGGAGNAPSVTGALRSQVLGSITRYKR